MSEREGEITCDMQLYYLEILKPTKGFSFCLPLLTQ